MVVVSNVKINVEDNALQIGKKIKRIEFYSIRFLERLLIMNRLIIDDEIKKDILDIDDLYLEFKKLIEVFRYKGEKIYIKQVNSLEELSLLLNEEVPEWVIGCYKYNYIYILKKSKWRDKNASTIRELILHEVVHIMINNTVKDTCPLWLNEGMAVYLSGQGRNIIENRNINIKNPYELSYDDDLYYNSYIVLKNIIDINSINKVIEVLYKSEDIYEDPILGEKAVILLCNNYNNDKGVSIMAGKAVVREAKFSDIEAIKELWRKLGVNQLSKDEYYLKENGEVKEFDCGNYFDNCLKNERCKIFVVEENGKVFGFVEIWIYDKDFYFNVSEYAYILHYYIDDEMRNYFAVIKLFDIAQRWAVEKGMNYLCADVFYHNDRVKRLLEHEKFSTYKTRFVKEL